MTRTRAPLGRSLRSTSFALLCAAPAAIGCGAAPPQPSSSASASVSAPASVSASVSAPAPVSASVSAPATASASASAAPASAPRRRAKLRFEADDSPFPAPLVDVILDGHPTTMMVDTGASHHFIAEWFAKELSIPINQAGDKGVDHAGRSIGVARAENVSLSISGWGAVDAPFFLVTALPEPLRKLGIGGVLAPQILAREGFATLLDLRGSSMSEEEPDDAERRLESIASSSSIANIRACGSSNEGMALVVDALIEGQRATLKIDSGAERSSIIASSPAGQLLLGRALSNKKTTTGYGAAGVYTVPTLEDAKLKLGDVEATVDLNLEPTRTLSSCGSDGFLGLDVLRTCALVLRGEKSTGRCAPR